MIPGTRASVLLNEPWDVGEALQYRRYPCVVCAVKENFDSAVLEMTPPFFYKAKEIRWLCVFPQYEGDSLQQEEGLLVIGANAFDEQLVRDFTLISPRKFATWYWCDWHYPMEQKDMKRHRLYPRSNWQQLVEEQGLTFHTLENGTPYWDESVCYEFSSAEVDMLEAAANEMQQMCLAAAQHVIDNERYAELEIEPAAIPMIEWAWENEPPAVYGRFDFSYDGVTPPKLLEYNADTPTSLLEAAVIQWSWMEQVKPGTDQFNSIHDRLIAKWKDVAPYLSKPVYFASVDSHEDLLTTTYMRDTAEQAGIPTQQLLMEEIGWDSARQIFVDLENRRMDSIFKLYPWETMVEEEFGASALDTYEQVKWIEPIWKMLLSNKGILPILWELYPDHPNLLPAYFADLSQAPAPGTVRKPMHSREGANITLVRADGSTYATDGDYTDRLCVDQALAPPAVFDGQYPVLGLWMIDQECGGMGIRESSEPVTGNLSRFVPHFFQ